MMVSEYNGRMKETLLQPHAAGLYPLALLAAGWPRRAINNAPMR
jgi:hypothetical protein